MTRRRCVSVLAMATFIAGIDARPVSAEWNPQLAARYLDSRQQQWFAWPPAASPDGPCVSCHTGMTYLMARPALRTVLHETQPTPFEVGILKRLRSKVGEKAPGPLQSVEVIMAALFLANEDRDAPMHADTRKAFAQLWSLQRQAGPSRGAWPWYVANLDPWEHPGSAFFGVALASHALGLTGPAYRQDPSVRENLPALLSYVDMAKRTARPLHDRLALLWASSTLPAVMSATERSVLMAEVFAKQRSDGGWTMEGLGPWSPHPEAPQAATPDSYATAYTSFVLEAAGVPVSDPRLARALSWLSTHQDAETGAWLTPSMNKRYPPASMEMLFMQDAATAYASLALINAGIVHTQPALPR